jgi:hypothetical protein
MISKEGIRADGRRTEIRPIINVSVRPRMAHPCLRAARRRPWWSAP